MSTRDHTRCSISSDPGKIHSLLRLRLELWISTSWSFGACIFFQCRKYFRYSQALEFRFSERQKFSQKLLKKQKTVIGIIVFSRRVDSWTLFCGWYCNRWNNHGVFLFWRCQKVSRSDWRCSFRIKRQKLQTIRLKIMKLLTL